jgi:hypothetical protein
MKQNKYHWISYKIYFHNNLFRDINANTIYYTLGKIWVSLTGTFHIIAFFMDGGSRIEISLS